MCRELISIRIINPSESVMKEILCHKTLNGLTKHCPKEKKKAPCTIFYTEIITTFPEGTTVDTSNLQHV